MNKITEDLQNEVQWELENNILPFWMNRMIDSEYGGFHGQITGNTFPNAASWESNVKRCWR